MILLGYDSYVSSLVNPGCFELTTMTAMAGKERVESLELAIKGFHLAQIPLARNCLLVLLSCKEGESIILPWTRRNREPEWINTKSSAHLAWAMKRWCADTDFWEARNCNSVCYPKCFFSYLLADRSGGAPTLMGPWGKWDAAVHQPDADCRCCGLVIPGWKWQGALGNQPEQSIMNYISVCPGSP